MCGRATGISVASPIRRVPLRRFARLSTGARPIDVAFVVAVIAVTAAAAGQAVTAIGFSLVAVPFVSVAVGPDAAVPTINLLASALNIIMLGAEFRATAWRDALRLFVPAALVIPVVGYLIEQLNSDALSVINGTAILAATALLASGARAPSLRGRRGVVIAGATSGAMNVATGVGGPPVAMFAINANWPAATYRPTIQAYFLAINIVSFAVRGVPDIEEAGLLPALGAAVLVGWFVGARLAKRLDDDLVRKLLLSIAALGGFVAIARGVL